MTTLAKQLLIALTTSPNVLSKSAKTLEFTSVKSDASVYHLRFSSNRTTFPMEMYDCGFTPDMVQTTLSIGTQTWFCNGSNTLKQIV